jgi:3-deoxy-D-manno-octulosonic-acid transferase
VTFLVLLLENLLFPFGALAVLVKFLVSPRRGVLKSLPEELRERFGRIPSPDARRQVVWFHAASAGEVGAVRPLIAALKKAKPEVSALVTTLTAAGRDRARSLREIDGSALAPLDFWPAVSSFLDRVRPRALVLVETELWPHMIALAAARGPVVLVNGRVSERSYGRYRLIAPFLRPFLSRLAVVLAQTEPDAQRFRALGAPEVVVTGNLKFDAPADPACAFPIPWKDPIFVAASTHPVEEEAVVDAWLKAREKEPKLKLILAPRHVERSRQAAELLSRRGVEFTTALAPSWPADALLVDRLGLLRGLYSGALACFVGGTLVPVGGHSLIEPALAGVVVLFGPNIQNTREPAQLLESAGAGFCVADAPALAAKLTDLVADRSRAKAQGELAKKTAEALQGATQATLERILPLLK